MFFGRSSRRVGHAGHAPFTRTACRPSGHSIPDEEIHRPMRKLRSLFGALGLLAALTAVNVASAAAQDKSLYERRGGEAAVSAVIDDFVARVAADSRINGKFA